MRVARSVKSVTVVVVALAVGGCESVRLYKESNNNLATEAKEKYDPDAINEIVKSANENFDTMRIRARDAASGRSGSLRNEAILNAVYRERPANAYFHDFIGPMDLISRGLISAAALKSTLDHLKLFTQTQATLSKQAGSGRNSGIPVSRCYAIDIVNESPTNFESQEFERTNIKPLQDAIAEIVKSLGKLDTSDDAEEITKLRKDRSDKRQKIVSSRKKFVEDYKKLAKACQAAAGPLKDLHELVTEYTARAKADVYDKKICKPDGTLTSGGSENAKASELKNICGLTKPTTMTDCSPDNVGGNDFLKNTCELIVAGVKARQRYAELDPLMNNLAAARKALKEAEEALKKAGEDSEKREKTLKKIDKAIGQFRKSLNVINKVGGYIGIRAIAAERVDAIDAIIDGFLSGTFDEEEISGAGLGKASEVLSFISGLKTIADRVKKRETDFDLSNLLLQRKVEAARLAFATAAITRQEREIDLRTLKVAAFASEFDFYRNINHNLCIVLALKRGSTPKCKKADNPTILFDIKASGGPLSDVSTGHILSGGNEAIRQHLVWAVTDTALVRGMPRLQQKRIEIELSLLDAEKQLSERKANVEMWDALIQVPLTQLQAYHAGGIKSSELADLIVKIAGLTGIIIQLD